MAKFRTAVVWGVMMARGENDEAVGYQAYCVPRSARGKGSEGREFVGPVRAEYVEARADAWAAQGE